VDYDDLMELARLCSLRASAASTPAVAAALRDMAEGYRARAAGLKEEQPPEVATEASRPSKADESLRPIQQQQQSQNPSTGADPEPAPAKPRRR
jgi:hypothetical protein